MMKFDVLTIFPELFDSFSGESLLNRAQNKKLLEIHVHNIRDWAKDAHRTVDDKPFGGGLGQVFKIEPIFLAVKDIKKGRKSKVVLFTPRGKKFTQKKAHEFSKLNQLIFICGRYEGVDERIAEHIADEELSIGDYVLMGGEIPAMIVIEAVSRLIPRVVGKPQFLKERRVQNGFIEYPQYTRPEIFKPKRGVKWKVPGVLVSGNHKEIEEWRQKKGRIIGK